MGNGIEFIALKIPVLVLLESSILTLTAQVSCWIVSLLLVLLLTPLIITVILF